MAESFDGTRLALYDLGRRDGPVLFLVNGLGGNITAWRFLIDYFRDRFRICSFDYRGMYNSELAATGDYSMEAHTKDALFVMDHLGIEDAVVMGWSMGVQVVFEIVRAAPERVRALVLANGAFGRPLDLIPGLKPVARAAMGLLAEAAPHLRPLARPLLRTTAPLKLLKAVGFVSRRLDEQVFLDIARKFAELDFAAYRDCVESLVNHDAEDVLDSVMAPTLILAGGRDLFTPASFSTIMAERIPEARLAHIPDASHYAAVEYPGVIISHMERFFLDFCVEERLPLRSQTPAH
jgi:3-oxoadipate enol-lactonase